MVAYSFKRRFVEPILVGTKGQTIRGLRKRHARPGEDLQLYVAMRTKQCRLIARSPCESVVPVRLLFHRAHGPISFDVDGVRLGSDAMERFAEADGFGESGYAALDMCGFWFETHGPDADEIDFEGVVIRWRPLVVAAIEREAGI